MGYANRMLRYQALVHAQQPGPLQWHRLQETVRVGGLARGAWRSAREKSALKLGPVSAGAPRRWPPTKSKVLGPTWDKQEANKQEVVQTAILHQEAIPPMIPKPGDDVLPALGMPGG
jgi:hypothetical protein